MSSQRLLPALGVKRREAIEERKVDIARCDVCVSATVAFGARGRGLMQCVLLSYMGHQLCARMCEAVGFGDGDPTSVAIV
jgi:hypothetical protein